jgi:hypothetical protein
LFQSILWTKNGLSGSNGTNVPQGDVTLIRRCTGVKRIFGGVATAARLT